MTARRTTAHVQHKSAIAWKRGIWIVFAAILCFSGLLQLAQVLPWPALASPLQPLNPDAWLRLALVREWVAGSDFFSHAVPRTNAPLGGITTPWTRPLDIVLGVFQSLMPSKTPEVRYMLASAWYPVLLALAAAALMAAAAQKIFRHNHVLACALLLMIASPYMPDYFKPGDADHHGLMSVLWCGVICLLLARKLPPSGLFLAGALLGGIIWISPEGLLLFAAALAVLGAGALPAGKKAATKVTPLFFVAFGAAVVSSIGIFMEIPAREILSRQTYDSLSVVHAAFLWLVTAGTGFMGLLWQFARTVAGRLYLTAASGIAVALLMHALYPKFFLGPLVDADPFIFSTFLPMVQEAQPLFHNVKISILRTLAEPLVATLLLIAAFRIKKLRPARRRQLLILAGLFGFTFLLTCFQTRWGYYLQPVAIIVGAALLPTVAIGWKKFGFAPRRWQPYLWLALVFGISMVALFAPLLTAKPGKTGGGCLQEMRYVVQTQQLQKLLGSRPLTFYVFEDVGGELLFFTPYRIIASNYHREAAGMKDMKAIREAKSAEELRRLLKKRAVDAMLYCPTYHRKGEILSVIDKKRPKWMTPVAGLRFSKTFFKTGKNPPLLMRVRP